jgi:hypothetical protein
MNSYSYGLEMMLASQPCNYAEKAWMLLRMTRSCDVAKARVEATKLCQG